MSFFQKECTTCRQKAFLINDNTKLCFHFKALDYMRNEINYVYQSASCGTACKVLAESPRLQMQTLARDSQSCSFCNATLRIPQLLVGSYNGCSTKARRTTGKLSHTSSSNTPRAHAGSQLAQYVRYYPSNNVCFLLFLVEPIRGLAMSCSMKSCSCLTGSSSQRFWSFSFPFCLKFRELSNVPQL